MESSSSNPCIEVPTQHPLAKRLQSAPEDICIRFKHKDYTVAEFCHTLARYKETLQKPPYSHFKKIAFITENSVDLIACILACLETGKCIIPLNTRLSDAELLEHLSRVHADFLILDKNTSLDFPHKSTLESLKASSFQAAYQPDKLDYDADALIVFTSGSYGKAKGVLHTLRSLFYAAIASNCVTGFDAQKSWLLSLPLYHLGGFQILIRCLVAYAKLIVISDQSVDAIRTTLQNTSPLYLSLVPSQLQALISEMGVEELATHSEKILLAGAPSAQALLDCIQQSSLNVLSCYGATETAAHCTCTRDDTANNLVSSVGQALPGTTITIVDDDGTPLPSNEAGIICIQSPQLAKGIIEDDGTFQAITPPLLMPDRGSLDTDGTLRVLGRIDDIFISGGENISTKDIEMQILASGMLKEAAVIAVPDLQWGQRPYLFAVLTPSYTEKELLDYMEAHIAKMKRPKEIILLKSLPKTGISKVAYSTLRQMIQEKLSVLR